MSRDSRYIDAADAAKLIRKALAREFPGVTFGVTTDKYSGGASVSIQWLDGPTDKQVNAVVGVYAGQGFDGMIDLAYGKDAWLLPDGTVKPARSQGTQGSMGLDPAYSYPKPHRDAELVHFGSGYIHCNRHESPELVRRVAKELEAKTGWTAPEIVETDSYWTRNKTVRTAYFKNWTRIEERDNWEEFQHALYLTPADSPVVTRFDYAFEDDGVIEAEPEPEQDPASKVVQFAPERTEAEQIAVFHETCQMIAEGRSFQTPSAAEQAAEVAPEPEPTQPAPADQLIAGFHEAIAEVAASILAAAPGPFVTRCIERKIDAIRGSGDVRALVQVGDDLLAIAERLGIAA